MVINNLSDRLQEQKTANQQKNQKQDQYKMGQSLHANAPKGKNNPLGTIFTLIIFIACIGGLYLFLKKRQEDPSFGDTTSTSAIASSIMSKFESVKEKIPFLKSPDNSSSLNLKNSSDAPLDKTFGDAPPLTLPDSMKEANQEAEKQLKENQPKEKKKFRDIAPVKSQTQIIKPENNSVVTQKVQTKTEIANIEESNIPGKRSMGVLPPVEIIPLPLPGQTNEISQSQKTSKTKSTIKRTNSKVNNAPQNSSSSSLQSIANSSAKPKETLKGKVLYRSKKLESISPVSFAPTNAPLIPEKTIPASRFISYTSLLPSLGVKPGSIESLIATPGAPENELAIRPNQVVTFETSYFKKADAIKFITNKLISLGFTRVQTPIDDYERGGTTVIEGADSMGNQMFFSFKSLAQLHGKRSFTDKCYRYK
jgi:hypothetical protein